MFNFFEKIDLLGSKFHFYDGLSLKKRTPLGGILTFLLLIISIYLIIIFGKELFMRNNPMITISTQNDSKYEYINLKKENLIFAFRIEDYHGNFINETNILYIKIYYYSSIPSDDGKFRSKSYDEFIEYHICNDNDMTTENLTKNYGTLYCPEFGNKTLGGYWDNPYIYFFEFQIFFCKNGSNYSENNTCTSIEFLKQFLNKENPRIFSLYYPVVEFDPLSYLNPLRIHYKNYYYYLNYQTQRSDDFFFKKTILNDDKGYLFDKIKNISLWGIETIASSYSFFSEKELNTEGSSSRIYTLKIYNTMENNYYTRNYIKIYNVIAIVGSLLNVILNSFIIINQSIGESLRKIDILNNFFEFEDNNNNYDFNFMKRNNSQTIIHTKLFTPPMIILNDNNLIKKKFEFFNPSLKNLSIIQHKSILKNTTQNNHKKKNNVVKYSLENKNKLTDQSNANLFKTKNSLPFDNYKKIKTKETFTPSKLTLHHIIFENFKIYFLFCCTNQKVYSKYFHIKNSNLLQYYYIYLIQINRYLKIIQEYEFFKKALLNVYQIKSLLFLKKINLTKKNEREEITENKNTPLIEDNVIEYFKTQLSLNTLSKLDKVILQNLTNNIKEKII